MLACWFDLFLTQNIAKWQIHIAMLIQIDRHILNISVNSNVQVKRQINGNRLRGVKDNLVNGPDTTLLQYGLYRVSHKKLTQVNFIISFRVAPK